MRDAASSPRLVVPEGLVVDEAVRERLERRLANAPANIAGVAAGIAELAPGASYRVHTEWMALEPAALVPLAGTSMRGAVLVRSGVECSVRDGSVEVPNGRLVVDPAAHAHDPHRAFGPRQPATELGRPPFTRRPVVVFLGCEPFRDTDWLRRLVNRLVRHDVEARIATPDGAADRGDDVYLTRPCLPVEETIRALAPDVVVTLDGTAAASVDAWCEGNRSTVVVEFDVGLSVPMELVPWQIGRASGRLRARIGRWVDVPAFAGLVIRLGAGPHPVPPADRPELLDHRTPVHESWTRREAAQGRDGCVVLTGRLDPPTRARLDGFTDNLEAEGISVTTVSVVASGTSTIPAVARGAALVILAGVTPSTETFDLLDERRRAGLPSALDLGPNDVEPSGPEPEAGPVSPRLTEPATTIGEACDFLVSPAGARRTAADGIGPRVLVLPTLLTRARAAALRDARTSADPTGILVIGWRLGGDGEPVADYAPAVAEGIARILTEHRDRVEIVGDAAAVPPALRGHERVTVVPGGDVDPDLVARWAVHVWTPRLFGADILDDARRFEEASCAGAASIMPTAARGGVDGFVSSHVLVDVVHDPENWYNALHHVLDDPGVRAVRAGEATRRADALDSLSTSKAVVSRFMGLACYRPEPGRV